jgi:hypothetical protein
MLLRRRASLGLSVEDATCAAKTRALDRRNWEMEATKSEQRTTAATAAPGPSPSSVGLRGGKAPFAHRIFFSNGRVIRGEIHRIPNSRLGDHLSMQKGFLSVTNAVCEETGQTFRYIVLVLSNVLFVEEVEHHEDGSDVD